MLYRCFVPVAVLMVVGWFGGPALAVEPPWVGFFEHGGGEPLRPPLEQYADADWLHLAFSEYSGPRVRLAVMAVGGLPELLEGTASESGIAEGLASALEKTHRFEVVTLTRGAAEKALADGRGPQGIQYLVRVTPGFPGVDDSIQLTFRIFDAVSGRVVFARTDSVDLRSRATRLSPLDALEACINKGTYRLASWLSQRPWAGSVVGVDHEWVVIDAGWQQGLAPEMQLRALIHQEVVDPESGELLGATTRGSGVLEVVEVRELEAVARVLEGCEELAPGDRVELLP